MSEAPRTLIQLSDLGGFLGRQSYATQGLVILPRSGLISSGFFVTSHGCKAMPMTSSKRNTEDEADLLFDVMRMRLVCSVCISPYQSRLYLSRKPALALLEWMDGICPAHLIVLCRAAAKPVTVANKAARDNALAAAGPLFDLDLNRAALVDWSDGLEPQRSANLPALVSFLALRGYKASLLWVLGRPSDEHRGR